jgi:hypothetical protein
MIFIKQVLGQTMKNGKLLIKKMMRRHGNFDERRLLCGIKDRRPKADTAATRFSALSARCRCFRSHILAVIDSAHAARLVYHPGRPGWFGQNDADAAPGRLAEEALSAR